MALPPLHKNSWESERILQFGNLVISISRSEDPEKPIWKRLWGFQNREQTIQTDFLFMFGNGLIELPNGNIKRFFTIVLGPIKLLVSRI